ncbi:hypothetical protein F25303_7463 [Fusarium sp. NRRL 25303]|nr:hypothetical protein F25303_7463 [Fusarium sp. NRRL 25303]
MDLLAEIEGIKGFSVLALDWDSRALAEFLNASTAGNKNCIFHPAMPSSPGIDITDTEAGLWSDDLRLHPQSLQKYPKTKDRPLLGRASKAEEKRATVIAEDEEESQSCNEAVNNNSDDSRDTNGRRRRGARSPSDPSDSDSLSEILFTQDRRVVTSRSASPKLEAASLKVVVDDYRSRGVVVRLGVYINSDTNSITFPWTGMKGGYVSDSNILFKAGRTQVDLRWEVIERYGNLPIRAATAKDVDRELRLWFNRVSAWVSKSAKTTMAVGGTDRGPEHHGVRVPNPPSTQANMTPSHASTA